MVELGHGPTETLPTYSVRKRRNSKMWLVPDTQAPFRDAIVVALNMVRGQFRPLITLLFLCI